MGDIEQTNAERRAIEALAQSLYEAQNPGGIAWVKRSRIVREPWLLRARQQLGAGRGLPLRRNPTKIG